MKAKYLLAIALVAASAAVTYTLVPSGPPKSIISAAESQWGSMWGISGDITGYHRGKMFLNSGEDTDRQSHGSPLPKGTKMYPVSVPVSETHTNAFLFFRDPYDDKWHWFSMN